MDTTSQFNCGGCKLWHATVVNDNGLFRSIFYALLPNESGASYLWAINDMKVILPSTDNV